MRDANRESCSTAAIYYENDNCQKLDNGGGAMDFCSGVTCSEGAGSDSVEPLKEQWNAWKASSMAKANLCLSFLFISVTE